ncbi:NFX1-type zinc finger-containing protein 1 [Phycodurus eques]|uniref:NFX1-type zinc finger-containing protein 1 n=1 Tax=Phycodurus eques TaxID=693459 RepID=UPI002ACDFA39|nr:NFX1-type zinc finger-containing protein 1 [Phycodurus eques]
MLRRGQKDGMNHNIGQRTDGGSRSRLGGTQDRSNIGRLMRFGQPEVVDAKGRGSGALQRNEEMAGGGGNLWLRSEGALGEKDRKNWEYKGNGAQRGGGAGGSGCQGGGERQRYRTRSNGRRDGAGERQRYNRGGSASTSRDATPQGPRSASRAGRQEGGERQACRTGGDGRTDGTGNSQSRNKERDGVPQGPRWTRGRGHQGGRERQGRQTWPDGRRDDTGDSQSQSRGSAACRDGVPQGPRLGFKSLLELSEKEPSVVAFTLCSHPALPGVLLETDMRQDLVELLCLVLSKAFKSRSNRVTLQRLASILKDSGFFRTTLPHYLAGMRSESRPDRRGQYPLHLENIVLILTQVLTNFPASSTEAVSLLLTLLQASTDGLRTAGVNVSAELVEKVRRLEDLVKHLQERSREGTLHKSKDTYGLLSFGLSGEEDEDPVFRTMPIYPTPEEFAQDHRPYLRPNITSQRYTNTLIYLDTHFRLMREDLVRRLREGIQKLRQMQLQANNAELKKKHYDDMLVYFDVKLEAHKYMLTGLAYVVQFDVEPLKFLRWENSRRLLYGSLVCLSCDNFESILYATVADRDPKMLNKGKVTIMFTDDSRFKLARMEKEQVFLMVETPAYFEAYRYVLEGLQEQDEDLLPFQRYIVECSKDVQPPAYLPGSDIYNLSSIAEANYKGHIRPFHSLNVDAWPKKEVFSLDDSQMSALELALTKELAIVQGPPGTGKTHVGLKIAQALLDNDSLWQDPGRNSQMLVVCYTNHALDQFLEGIYKFMPKGIVRVGGRSNSELLKSFNLREVALSLTFKQRQPSYLRYAFKEIHLKLHALEDEIKRHGRQLQCSRTGILQEIILQKFIMERHWSSLHQPLDLGIWNGKSSLITEWLGLGPGGILQMETEDTNMDEDEVVTESEQEQLIEVTEEADLIQAERIIEDNIVTKRRYDAKKEHLMEAMALERMQKSMLAMSLDQGEKNPEQTEEEWTFQRDQKRKMKRKIIRELGNDIAMSEEEERRILDIWALSMADRWRLYRLWMVRFRADIRKDAVIHEEQYQEAADRYAEIKRDETFTILQMAKVIGMTTTGAAKFRKVLQELRPRVVIVEEAAEVLEAHIITALSEACQHLILIGDHQQLRPSSTEYDLERNYKMGVSMFERLVNMGLPFVRLNQQHRMRPEIARLLTPHIYKDLENHPSVLNFENIKGLKTNLFFVEHNQLEKQFKEGKSHQNLHEATFVVALCRYLLLQEYKPEQITILTTYTAQLQCLRRLMPASQFSGVRVHVVDKYQGEENDIVLLSLVRSNMQGKVGFLNISNRVCVALSRAKKGLYCIGNSEMLGQVKLWSDIFSTLREKDQVGGSLTLCCQNHPERQVQASCVDDFNQAPEGGCTQPCEFRLNCGHVCTSVCHPYDQDHENYKCVKDCTKIICLLGHTCTLVCHAECPKECPVRVEKIIPKCQHKQMVPCHQDPGTFICKIPCQSTLQCGHRCDSWCGLPCTSRCMVNVMLQLRCGHSQEGACFYQTQEDEPPCKTPCEQQLMCGHACRGTCGQCYNGRFHFPCFHQCDRLLICSHKCTGPCTRDCPPCQKPCENCCVHSKCMKTCGEPCTPCNEPCACQCPHQSCSKLCHEPCDRPPCTQTCAQTLGCGHPCIGLCGDKCPNKCRICHEDEVTDIFFGMEDEPEARFIQLEDCGHIIEHTSMDTYMGVDDKNHANEEGQVAIKLKECPKCRTPIRKNLRYGSHINRSLTAIEMVKKKINGDQVDMKKRSGELKISFLGLCGQGMLGEDQYLHMERILTSNHVTVNDIWVLENKLNFLLKIQKLQTVVRNETNAEVDKFRNTIDIFLLWVNNFHQKFTEQQIFDLQREVQRLMFWAEFIALCSTAVKLRKSNNIETEKQIVDEALGKHGQFTEQDEQGVNEALKVMKQKVPVTGLGISDEERKMIVLAMKMRSGHWYQCPNGHVYVITECGGAMEARRCTDCDAIIGGGNHMLASGNTVASVMDGARYGAWSEANNLNNFEDLYQD